MEKIISVGGNLKKVLFGLIVIIFSCNRVYASECSNEDRVRLQKFADNITYTLEEYEENGEKYFKVIFTGLSKEIRIYSDRRRFYYYNFSDNLFDEVDLKVYPGKIYQFTINGVNTCKYNDFRTITINIPNYNPYYSDEVCKNTREYKLCQKWTTIDMSYEEFVSKVTKYKKKQQEVIDDNPISENATNNFNFLDIYDKYYWPTFIGLICLLILLIILWIRQNKKNRL